MMNGVSAINNQSQMTFKAKAGNRKQMHEFIDRSSDLAMEFFNKDRPIAEKRENMIRRYVSKFMEIMNRDSAKKNKEYEGYIEKAVEYGMMDADHAGTLLINKQKVKRSEMNKLIETVNRVYRQTYLDELRKTDPEIYKEIIMRDAEYEAASGGNIQMLKDMVKKIFKKD